MQEGTKFDSDKERFDLIPVLPLLEVAKLYTKGAAKYEDRNWEKGIRWGRIFAAMMRHAWKWWAGEKYDQEDGQHHLASVAWCALTLMEYERTRPEFDDRQQTNIPLKETNDKPRSSLHELYANFILEDPQPFKTYVIPEEKKNQIPEE